MLTFMAKYRVGRSLAVFLLLACAITLAYGQANNSIVGKWDFALETPGGDRQAKAEFELDGDQVKGKWGETPVKGTFTGSKLELNFPINSEEGGSGDLKISGTVDGGTIKGTWAFAEYNGTFTAKRVD